MKEITKENKNNEVFEGTYLILQKFNAAHTSKTLKPTRQYLKGALEEFANTVRNSVITETSVELMFGQWSEADQALVNVQIVKIS